jgi:hypothetical protein
MYYRVTGEFKGTTFDRDGYIVASDTGSVDRIVQAETPEEAAELALKKSARAYDKPEWTNPPEVKEVPTDQVMNLIGAERLPGF